MWPYTCRWSEKGDNCMENHVSKEKKKRERERKKKKDAQINLTKPNQTTNPETKGNRNTLGKILKLIAGYF